MESNKNLRVPLPPLFFFDVAISYSLRWYPYVRGGGKGGGGATHHIVERGVQFDVDELVRVFLEG